MYRAPVYWPSACPFREKSAMGSTSNMRQLAPQVLQQKAAFSEGMKYQWQPTKAAISESSNRGCNGISDTSKEFGLMIREQLQEFAMILTKKYHYKFLAEYFDDYQGSFNKEEFLGIKCSNAKSRRQEADFQPCDSIFSNSNNHGGLDQGVWSKEGLKEHIGSFREEEMMETTNQKTDIAENDINPQDAIAEKLKEEMGAAIDEEPLAGFEVAALPNSDANWQPWLECQRECPLDLKEAISSVCFAAPRCADLPELLQPIELPSVRAPDPDVQMKLLKEIAEKHELEWDPTASETELLKPHEDLLNGPTASKQFLPFIFSPSTSSATFSMGIDLDILRTKKKKPRRRKREKAIKQKIKVGVG